MKSIIPLVALVALCLYLVYNNNGAYEQGFADGQADPITIMEYCIKEEAVETGTFYFRAGSTTAVFIEDEQGTHVVKMCDNN